MVNKAYGKLTVSEKTKDVILDSGVYAFFHDEPETAIDTQGISSPVTIPQKVELVNNESFTLYFRAVLFITNGDPTKWGNIDAQLGSVSAANIALKTWNLTREIPDDLTVELATIKIYAYTDAAYTQFYGSDSVDWTFYFFDHSHPAAIIIDEDDFEGSLEGWTNGGYNTVNYKPTCPYKGAQSMIIGQIGYSPQTWEYDASGFPVPKKSYKVYKNFTVGNYPYAFIVVHYTRNGTFADPALRIHFDTKDYIIKTNMPLATCETWRCACPIPTNKTTTIKLSVSTQNQMIGVAALDDIIVLAFPS